MPPSEQPIDGKCGSLINHWKQKFGVKKYCTKPPTNGRTRCFKHGGKTPQGINSPHFKHGKRSKVFPKGFYQKTFDEVFNDPQLKNVRKDIASMEVRITELRSLLKSDTGDGDIVKELKKIHSKLSRADKRKGKVSIKDELLKLESCLGRVQSIRSIWNELSLYVGRKDRLITNEHKREMDTYQTISLDQMVHLATLWATILIENIPDKKLSEKINEKIRVTLLPKMKTIGGGTTSV